jgi:poly(hydroxyalkanoate) depolymerase family esterase
MKLRNKLFSQMRAATRAMLGRGPTAVAATVMQEAIKNVSAVQQEAIKNMSAVQQAMLPFHEPAQPPAFEDASNQPAYDQARVLEEAVPEMLARLGRIDDPGLGLFGTPAHGKGIADGVPGTFTDQSYTNEAGSRSYKLYVPSSYTGKPAPLVVMLHGCTQDPDDFALGTEMNVLAEESGCLVVYPAQSTQANMSRCWNWFNALDQQRDQGEPSIIAGITREVMSSHAVEPGAVYVAGLSAGGAMATIMGTLYPELYAAVGVHSGLPFASAHDLASALSAMRGDFKRASEPEPGTAFPIIVFHGDRDTTVHPAAGEELIAHVRHVSKDVAVEPGAVPEGYKYTRTLHQREDGLVHAEHWVIHGAGHAWSGGNARGSYTDGKGPNASREMMRFFRTHR